MSLFLFFFPFLFLRLCIICQSPLRPILFLQFSFPPFHLSQRTCIILFEPKSECFRCNKSKMTMEQCQSCPEPDSSSHRSETSTSKMFIFVFLSLSPFSLCSSTSFLHPIDFASESFATLHSVVFSPYSLSSPSPSAISPFPTQPLPFSLLLCRSRSLAVLGVVP